MYSSSSRSRSLSALSSARENAAEPPGCCWPPWIVGAAASVRSASARSPCQSVNRSWSSSASNRWPGVISGLPRRRARSCAAATASWLLIVSLLKSIGSVPFLVGSHGGRLRRPVENEVAPVMTVHRVERAPHLLLHALHAPAQPLELVLHAQHALDARQVQPPLARQPLDQPQPLDVRVGVETRVARRALRVDEALLLVDAQRLRVHPDELCGDADHVARAVRVGHVRRLPSATARAARAASCSPSWGPRS